MQAMMAVIGETGIRKGEASSLTWKRVDLGRRMLRVEFTKDDEPREISLSKYAARYLARLVRYLNTPYVFVNSRTGTRWVNPDKSLRRAAERVGLKVGFHDLRSGSFPTPTHSGGLKVPPPVPHVFEGVGVFLPPLPRGD